MNRATLAGLLLTLPAAPGLLGCETLGLQSETAVVDDRRYLFFRPWIHYEVSGSGPPMLLVHGLPGDLSTWRNVVDPLSKYFEVFRMDLGGFGGSANPYRDYDLEFYSSQVAAFIREMDLGPTIVVGHNIGGTVALDAFLRFPTEVQSVVLLNSAGFDVAGPELAEDLDLIGRALFNYQGEADMERLVATAVESPLKKLYTDEKWYSPDEAGRLAANLKTEEGRRAWLEALRTFRPSDVVGRLMAKADELRIRSKGERRGERDVLVIWGAKDPWFPPRMAEYFRARIPGAKVAILKEAGHFVHVEQAETVAGLIIDVMLPRPVSDNRFSIQKYDADYLLEQGRTHKRRKEWAAALEAFNKALERNPYLGLAYYEIGDLLFLQQQFAESLEMLHRSLEIYPENAAVHYRMGATYHNQATELAVRLRSQGTDDETIADITEAKMAEAVASYEEAARLDPSLPNPWYNLGRIYTELGRWADAARVYGGLSKADPTNARTHRLHVDALLKAKDLAGASAALDGLAGVEKGNAEVFAMLGRVRRDLGRWDEAAEALERAVSLDARTEQYAVDLALVYLRQDKADEALSNVNRILTKNPGNPQALLIRGQVYLQMKEWQKSAEDFDKSVQSDKRSEPARLGAARASLALRRPDKVLDYLAPLLAADPPPREPLVFITAAKAYLQQAADAAGGEGEGEDAQPRKGRGKAKAGKERAADLLARAVEMLAKAVEAGQDPGIFVKDPDFAPLHKDPGFRAVLKMKAPPPPLDVQPAPAAQTAPAAADKDKDKGKGEDDDDDESADDDVYKPAESPDSDAE